MSKSDLRLDLINMKLHESFMDCSGCYYITRVMGGWIYCRQEPQANIANPVFVPYTTQL